MYAVVSCFAIEPSLISTQVYRDVVTALSTLDASVLHLLSDTLSKERRNLLGENAHVKGIVCEREDRCFANRNKFHSLHGLKRCRNCGLVSKARYTDVLNYTVQETIAPVLSLQ